MSDIGECGQVWLRGRTVAALMALTAVVAGIGTYTAFHLPGLDITLPARDRAEPTEDGLNRAELDKFNKAFDLIERKFLLPAERKTLVDGAIKGMVDALGDPHSAYKTEEQAADFTNAVEGAFTGIGAELTIVSGAIVVESPIKGSPAERAGLQPLDVLLSVNGESLDGLTLDQAKIMLRGPKGTKAKLKVQREGIADPLDLEMVRDRITLETVHADVGADGIGHLRINQFANDTTAQVKAELAAMEAIGLKGLVIDVRDNPGGMLQQVVQIAELFTERGKVVVQYEYRDGKRENEVAKNGLARAKPYPLVVLMNKGSASAAEILAGALKQSANARLVGDASYGKGTVQVSYDKELEDGSLIKLTVYKWLLPDGTWIDGKGIVPDVKAPQPDYFLASRLPRDMALAYDMTGEEVKNLQIVLEGVGFEPDRKDGYFSKGTESALKQFQNREKLPITGVTDEATERRLEEVLYAKLQNPAEDEQWQTALEEAREMAKTSS